MFERLLTALAALPLAAFPAWADEGLIKYSADDPRMNAAIAAAQHNLPAFDAALRNGGGARFSIKVRVAYGTGGRAEHLWMVDIKPGRDGGYAGIVGNEVEFVEGLYKGAPFQAARKDVSDWMYSDARGTHGAYTFRVMLQDMAPEVRAKFAIRFVD